MDKKTKEVLDLYLQHRKNQHKRVNVVLLLAMVITWFVSKSILWIPFLILALSYVSERILENRIDMGDFGTKEYERKRLESFANKMKMNKK